MRSLALALATPILTVPVIAVAQTAPTAMTTAQQLRKLFVDSDEASLRRNPLNALFSGDLRYADRLGDFGTEASFKALAYIRAFSVSGELMITLSLASTRFPPWDHSAQ